MAFIRAYIIFVMSFTKLMGLLIFSVLFLDILTMSSSYLGVVVNTNFWEDAHAFAVGEKTVDTLEEKYPGNFKAIAETAFWMFIPSEKTIQFRLQMSLETGGTIQEILILMILFYLLFSRMIRWLVKIFLAEEMYDSNMHESFFNTTSYAARISYAISFIIVLLLSYINALFAYKTIHVDFWDLTLLYFVLSYTSAIWFLLIKYIIDSVYLTNGQDPRKTFKDDIIATILTFVLLVFYGNSMLSILSELVAGAIPFFLCKAIIRRYPEGHLSQHRKPFMHRFTSFFDATGPTYRSFILGAFGMVIFAVIICRVTVFDGMTWTDNVKAYERHRYELWNKKIWRSYLQQQMSAIRDYDVQRLINSQEPKHRNSIATIYAWQKNKQQAQKFAKNALPETAKRIELLLMGKSPKQVEQIIAQLKKK